MNVAIPHIHSSPHAMCTATAAYLSSWPQKVALETMVYRSVVQEEQSTWQLDISLKTVSLCCGQANLIKYIRATAHLLFPLGTWESTYS